MSRQRIFKAPSYREAIEYIALNDEPTEMSAEEMTGMPSVHTVSVIFGTPLEVVAADVIRYRERDIDAEERRSRLSAESEAEEQAEFERRERNIPPF